MSENFHSEPVRGTIGDIGRLILPGAEAARAMVRGEMAPPPIHHLMGIRPTEAGLGSMTWEMPITPWLQDRYGVIWGGVYALFADAVVGGALYTGLPPGKVVTTSELALSYIRPATLASGRLIGRGTAVHLGHEVGLSSAEITDRHGRLLAYASTRCLVLDIPPPDDMTPLPVPDPVGDPPDPYLRPVPDHRLADWGELAEMSPAEVLRDLDLGPITHVTGHRPTDMGDGTFELTWPASPWFSAGMPTMYGGAIALGLDLGLTSAIWTTLDDGAFAASIDLHVRFLRPPFLDGSDLTVRAEVDHRGRRLRVAHAEMRDAGDRLIAKATGSAVLVEGGVQHLLEGRLPDEWSHPPGDQQA